MAQTIDEKRDQIVADVLGVALAEIVARCEVESLIVTRLRIDARLYLSTYSKSHPGDKFGAEYTDERA